MDIYGLKLRVQGDLKNEHPNISHLFVDSQQYHQCKVAPTPHNFPNLRRWTAGCEISSQHLKAVKARSGRGVLPSFIMCAAPCGAEFYHSDHHLDHLWCDPFLGKIIISSPVFESITVLFTVLSDVHDVSEHQKTLCFVGQNAHVHDRGFHLATHSLATCVLNSATSSWFSSYSFPSSSSSSSTASSTLNPKT